MRFSKLHISHLLTFAVIVIIAVLFTFVKGHRSTNDSQKGLAVQISEATNMIVDEESLSWMGDHSHGGLISASKNSSLYFLAATKEGVPKDLFCIKLRYGPNQRLISVDNITNLTNSSAGDDFKILISAPHIVVSTRVLNQIRSMTIFDTSGQKLPSGEGWSLLQRTLAKISDFQHTGSLYGVGRMTIRFILPPKKVEALFVEDGQAKGLVVNWTDLNEKSHLTSVDVTSGHTQTNKIVVNKEVRLPKRPVLWMVDTVRAIPWIGPGPIEWAEGRFFALRDKLRRMTYSLKYDEDKIYEEDVARVSQKEIIELPKGLEIGKEDPPFDWPPTELEPPVFKRKRKSEGIWTPAVPDFVRVLPGAPPSVYRTYIRSDIRRPYVKVHLLAMDLRQLNLNMVAGHEDPRSTTGATGEGRLPRDPKVLSQVIAAFNGAFKTEHGAYGMMVDRNVLLPPKDDAATVASLKDGTVVMGSWPTGMEIPEDMMSYRQNIDPLVENGVVNPKRRYLWGFTLDEDIKNMNTIRSGICISKSGALIYAWGEDLTATTMGIAMNASGCEYGMHLDMNPFHTAYFFYRFEDDIDLDKKLSFKSELMFKEMRFSPKRYVNGAPKDFFFVTLKNTTPGKDWSAKDLAQSAPAFVPTIFRKDADQVRMIAADLTRISINLSSGSVPEALAPPHSYNETISEEKVLVEINLGPWSSGRGQIINGAIVASMERDQATLTQDANGLFSITPWPVANKTTDAIQGNWIIRNGTSVDQDNHDHIIAIGCDDSHWLVIAEGSWHHVSSALINLNVKDAIAFDQQKNSNQVLVRGALGMMTLDKDLVETRNSEAARFIINAKPRHLGAKTLQQN